MTTNQTIDGVPREHLAAWAERLERAESGFHGSVPFLKELRALLDAPDQSSKIDALRAEVEKWKGIAGRRTAERTEFMNERDDLKATQPQGEPVCYLVNDRFGGKAYLEEGSEALAVRRRLGFTDEIPLYAEQPAPVAVVMPERPYASEEDQQSMTEYEIGLGHGACEMWDKIKTLNATQPHHANPPPGTEPSGTHHDNYGLDEWRKPK